MFEGEKEGVSLGQEAALGGVARRPSRLAPLVLGESVGYEAPRERASVAAAASSLSSSPLVLPKCAHAWRGTQRRLRGVLSDEGGVAGLSRCSLVMISQGA